MPSLLPFLSSPIDAPTFDRPLDDPRMWLETVDGKAQLDYVKAKNADALATLGNPEEQETYKRIIAILDSKEKIPYIGRVLNGLYYNFWQDDVHVKGIWRRCTLAEYRKDEPGWETVLDLDALSKEEGKTWVWGGSVVLDEGPDVPTDRVLIKLSDGGADAKHVREFDINKKTFVPPGACVRAPSLSVSRTPANIFLVCRCARHRRSRQALHPTRGQMAVLMEGPRHPINRRVEGALRCGRGHLVRLCTYRA